VPPPGGNLWVKTVGSHPGCYPWFVAADVSRALDIRNPSDARRQLREDEKGSESFDTPGSLRLM
jgi:prophage antirepressor-like protein